MWSQGQYFSSSYLWRRVNLGRKAFNTFQVTWLLGSLTLPVSMMWIGVGGLVAFSHCMVFCLCVVLAIGGTIWLSVGACWSVPSSVRTRWWGVEKLQPHSTWWWETSTGYGISQAWFESSTMPGTSYITLASCLSLWACFLTYKMRMTISTCFKDDLVDRKGKPTPNGLVVKETLYYIIEKSRARTSGIVWSGIWLYFSAIALVLAPSYLVCWLHPQAGLLHVVRYL